MSNQPDNHRGAFANERKALNNFNERIHEKITEIEARLNRVRQENQKNEVTKRLEQKLQKELMELKLKIANANNPKFILDPKSAESYANNQKTNPPMSGNYQNQNNTLNPIIGESYASNNPLAIDDSNAESYAKKNTAFPPMKGDSADNFDVGYNPTNKNNTLNPQIGETYINNENALENQEWENFKRELISFIKENPQVLERLKRMENVLCKTDTHKKVSSNGQIEYFALREEESISANENDKIDIGESIGIITYRELYDYYSMMNNDGNWEFPFHEYQQQQQNQTSTTKPKPVTKNNETISPNPNYSDNNILNELEKVLKEKHNWEISSEDLIIKLTGSTQLRKLYDEIKNRKSNNITESKKGENNAKEISENSENYEKKVRNKQAQDIINTISTFDNEDADLVIDGIIGENTRFELENQIINKYSDCTFAIKKGDKWGSEKIIKKGENIDSFLTEDKKYFSEKGLKKLEKIYQYKINIEAQKILSKISSYSITGIRKKGKNKLDGIIGPNSKEALKKILEKHKGETVTIKIDDKEEKIIIDKNISQFFDEDEKNISKKGLLILEAIKEKEDDTE